MVTLHKGWRHAAHHSGALQLQLYAIGQDAIGQYGWRYSEEPDSSIRNQ